MIHDSRYVIRIVMLWYNLHPRSLMQPTWLSSGCEVVAGRRGCLRGRVRLVEFLITCQSDLQVSMSIMSRLEGNVYLSMNNHKRNTEQQMSLHSRPCFVGLGRQEQMISLVIHVDSLCHQFHNVRRNRSLKYNRISECDMAPRFPTHLVICRMVLANQLLYLGWRQDPADIEQDVNVGSRSLIQAQSLALIRRLPASLLPFSAVEAWSLASSFPTGSDSPAYRVTCTILRFG